MWCAHKMKYHSVTEKEENPSICNNMEEPGGHYTKWHGPGTEGQVLHDTTYITHIK